MRFLVGRANDRTVKMLAGAITMTLLVSLTVFGVRAANGALRPRYQVLASFSAAGQGLISKSDVKIRGVNIGSVKTVKLRGGRALVRMDIDKGEHIPVDASATIRPKTLFGEKFVDIDPGPKEDSGPYLRDEGRIADTTGGFELERVLAEAYPILKAIDPDELATVISELARAGDGEGPTVNRTIVNFGKVAAVQAAHAQDTQRFLDDLALLSDQLAKSAPGLVDTARDLNVALPPLNDRGAELSTVLDQTARLSSDVADLLEANRPFSEKLVTEGGRTLQVLYDHRAELPGLIRGLREFFESLSSVGRIDLGDGTKLAAVKGILGGGAACGRTSVGCPAYSGPVAGRSAPGGGAPFAPAAGTPGGTADGSAAVVPGEVPPPASGVAGVVSIVRGLVG